MAKINIKHINYVIPGEKETLVNADIEFKNQFNGNIETKTVTYVLDIEDDMDNHSIEPFKEINKNNFNNRHAMLLNQEGETTVLSSTNDENERGYNLGRAAYDIKDVALKSAVASQLVDSSQKEQKDVDSGSIDIYAPHAVEDPIGFCQVKNYSYGLAAPTRVAPVLQQTSLQNYLLNTINNPEAQKLAKVEYSYFLNPRNSTLREDLVENFIENIDNALPTYTYVNLDELSIPKENLNTFSDLIGSPLSVLLSARTKDGEYVSPYAGKSKIYLDTYVLSAPDPQSQGAILTCNINLSVSLDSINGNTKFNNIVAFSRKPHSLYQYVQSFKSLSNDVISTLLMPKVNSMEMDHNYIYEVPLNKRQFNKYDLGLVQGDFVVSKNAYNAEYSTNLSAKADFKQTREYIGIGARGNKIFLKYLDDVGYNRKQLQDAKVKGLSNVYDKNHTLETTNEAAEKIDKGDVVRTYQKVEVLETINRFLAETKHKANIFNVNIHGLMPILDNVIEDENTKEIIKRDIKNSIKALVNRFIPAHTQLVDVTFDDKNQELVC